MSERQRLLLVLLVFDNKATASRQKSFTFIFSV